MQPSPPREAPLGLLASALRRGVRQLIERRVAPLGLTAQQFWFLVGIAECPHGAQCEIATRLRVDETVASRVIRSLAARGLVRASRDHADRRRVTLDLTSDGERLVARLLPVAQEIRAAVEAPLSPAERAAARAALLKVVTHLQSLVDAPAARPEPPEVQDAQARPRRGARRAAPARRLSPGR